VRRRSWPFAAALALFVAVLGVLPHLRFSLLVGEPAHFFSAYDEDLYALWAFAGEGPLLPHRWLSSVVLRALSWAWGGSWGLAMVLADVVFPAACFAEKDGTFTNSERRVQRVRKAIEPAGEAKPDWRIISEIARRMGAMGFDFEGPEQVFGEIASVTPSYAGISYQRIEKKGLQWPCPAPDHPGTQYLHREKFVLPNGKGKFMPLEYRESAELPTGQYPLLLTTDRSLYHYHTSTMTMRVEGLKALGDRERLKIHPDDASRHGVVDGQKVKVVSRRGQVEVDVQVTDVCPPGIVSMTFHFPDVPTNVLTNSATDPVAKIPETKVCAVRIEP